MKRAKNGTIWEILDIQKIKNCPDFNFIISIIDLIFPGTNVALNEKAYCTQKIAVLPHILLSNL